MTPGDSGSVGGRALRVPVLLFVLTAITCTLAQGPAYAVTLLAILVAHEMGHFVVARRLGLAASLPHFIPLPPLSAFTLGTLGAVIRMDDRGASRRALLRVGAAGPIAGFVVAVPAMVLGLRLSVPGRLDPEQGVLFFGTSLLSAFLESVLGPEVAEGEALIAHPVYVAAWAGFLVTALNLFPMGQLDGGHVLHALAPERSARIARVVWATVLGLGLVGLVVVGVEAISLPWAHRLAFLRPWVSPGLLVWAALTSFLGVAHPRGSGEEEPLRPLDRCLAAICGLILVACFMPSPIYAPPPPLSSADGSARVPDRPEGEPIWLVEERAPGLVRPAVDSVCSCGHPLVT